MLESCQIWGKFLKNARHTQSKKVQKDNVRFLKRLNNTKATFNSKDWIRDYNRHKKDQEEYVQTREPQVVFQEKKAR